MSRPKPWVLGPYGRNLVAQIARHTAMFVGAACVLFFAFEAVETANTGRGFFPHAVARLPEVIQRVTQLALLLAGITAGHGAHRRSELVGWFSAGGHPAALFIGAIAFGCAIASIGVFVGPSTPRDDDARLTLWVEDELIQLQGVVIPRGHIEHASGLVVDEGRVRHRWTATSIRWRDGSWWPAHRLSRRFAGPGKITTSTGSVALKTIPDLTTLARLLGRAPHAETAMLRRAYGQPYRSVELAAHRRWSTPMAWALAAVLGLGISLNFGVRTPPFRPIAAGLMAAFVWYSADESVAVMVAATLIPPIVGAWIGPLLAAVATVTVWRNVFTRGIRY